MEGLAGLLPLILLIGVFWLLIIRPQQKRVSAHRELVSSLTTMDRVVTSGGLHGTVQSIDEDTVRLEIAPGTTVTVAKQYIVSKVVDADSGDTSEA